MDPRSSAIYSPLLIDRIGEMKMQHNFKRAFSLVELLVVIAVLAIAAAYFLPRYLGGTSLDGKKHKSPIEAAHGVECQSYLLQVRQGINMSKINDEKLPETMAALKLPAEVTHCPVGHEEYVYDPAKGEVHCPHPGHENY
jgi:prepilin-type N-terminal cleavage/methylation domain-containing protein